MGQSPLRGNSGQGNPGQLTETLIGMTAAPLKNALSKRDDTAAWLRTRQAARMARIDEQVRGQSAGLVAGSDNSAALREWINTTYGPLPDLETPLDLPLVDQQAARLRHWQADRLASSVILLVNSAPQAAARSLARTGGFTSTPELPPFLDAAQLTLVWPDNYDAGGSHHVVGPGGLPGENRCCAITIDQANQRIIEWSPAPQLDDLGVDLARMTRQAGGTLPPWLLSGDTRYQPAARTIDQHRAAIMAAASTTPDPTVPTLMEEANAVVSAMAAGLFTLNAQTVADQRVFTLAAP